MYLLFPIYFLISNLGGGTGLKEDEEKGCVNIWQLTQGAEAVLRGDTTGPNTTASKLFIAG